MIPLFRRALQLIKAKHFRLKVKMLPVYNPGVDEWLVMDEDGKLINIPAKDMTGPVYRRYAGI